MMFQGKLLKIGLDLFFSGDPATDIIELFVHVLDLLLLQRHLMQLLSVDFGFFLLVPLSFGPNVLEQLLTTFDGIFDRFLVLFDEVCDEPHVSQVLLSGCLLRLQRH